jgi:hypothetical protein
MICMQYAVNLFTNIPVTSCHQQISHVIDGLSIDDHLDLSILSNSGIRFLNNNSLMH